MQCTCPRIPLFIYLFIWVEWDPFIQKLWIFLFKEVKRKSKNADDQTEVRKIFRARGAMFLESILEGVDWSNLLVYVTKANYDSSVIMSDIATEMWYNRERNN